MGEIVPFELKGEEIRVFVPHNKKVKWSYLIDLISAKTVLSPSTVEEILLTISDGCTPRERERIVKISERSNQEFVCLPNMIIRGKIIVKTIKNGAEADQEEGEHSDGIEEDDYSNDNTQLHYSCICNDLLVAQTILRGGHTSVNVLNERGQTPLLLACRHGNLEMVRYLIENGANTFPEDENWSGAMHYAAQSGNVQLLDFLVKVVGHPITIKNKMNQTPIDIARKYHKLESLKYLMSSYTTEEHDIAVDATNTFTESSEIDISDIQKEISPESNSSKEKIHQEVETPPNFHRCPLESFFLSCVEGNLEMVKNYLISGGRINVTNEDGFQAIHFAACGGHILILQYIIDRGADVEVVNSSGNTALHLACVEGHEDTIKWLITKAGANVTALNNDQLSPIHLLCKGQNLSILEWFIHNRKEYSIFLEGKVGTIPLVHLACHSKEKHILETLLQNGFKFDSKDECDRNILHLASISLNVAAIEWIVKQPAAVDIINQVDASHSSPLYYACQFGSKKIAKILLNHGADPTLRNLVGNTCIHAACESGNLMLVILLVQMGMSPHLKNHENLSSIQLAQRFGHEDLVNYLKSIPCLDENILEKIRKVCLQNDLTGLKKIISEGYDIIQVVTTKMQNEPHSQKTIFSEICREGLVEVCDFFSSLGVPLDQPDSRGYTPMHYGVQENHLEFVDWLLSKGISPLQESKDEFGLTAVHLAAQYGFIDVLRLFLEKKIELNSRSTHGSTPLFEAIKNNQIETVTFLIEHLNVGEEFLLTKPTVLHVAASTGELEMMKLILSLLEERKSEGENKDSTNDFTGVDLEIEDENGLTPFFYACGAGKVPLMNYLFDQRCNVFHRAVKSKNISALHVTISAGHLEATRWLLDHGLNPEYRNDNNVRALEMVPPQVSKAMTKLLSKYPPMQQISNYLDPYFDQLLDSKRYRVAISVLREMISIAPNPDDYQREDGTTFMHLAAAVGSRRLINKLYKLHFNLNALNNFHLAPLHFAVLHDHVEAMLILQQLGAKMTIKDDIGNSALHIAADLGFESLLNSLLGFWNNINLKNQKGWTALHYACSRGFGNIVKILLESGATATIADGGVTPLHLACYNNYSEIAIYLICQSDVDINLADDSGMRAVDIAESNDLYDVIQLIERSEIPLHPQISQKPQSFFSLFTCTS